MTSLRSYLDQVLAACATLKEVNEGGKNIFLTSVYKDQQFHVTIVETRTGHGWVFCHKGNETRGTTPDQLARLVEAQPRY
jgi:hypothetical protein